VDSAWVNELNEKAKDIVEKYPEPATPYTNENS